MENPIEHLRMLRNVDDNSTRLEYGLAPRVILSAHPPAGLGYVIFVVVSIASLISCLAFGKTFWVSLNNALSWGLMAAVVYLLLPILFFLILLAKRFLKSITRFFASSASSASSSVDSTGSADAIHYVDLINKFSSSQKWFTCLALSFALATGIDTLLPKVFKLWQKTHPHFYYRVHQTILGGGAVGALNVSQFLAAWLFFLVLTGLFLVLLFRALNKQALSPSQFLPPQVMSKRSKRVKKASAKNAKNKSEAVCEQPFGLWVGNSTGYLASLCHGAGIALNQQITLRLEDAAQNILILGAIGSGKTTRAMHPLLVQLLDQDCGGLIFDIKGDFQKAVLAIANAVNREIITIGVNHHKMNLLAGLTPEVASSFLKSIFMLGSNNQSDGFWLDTAVELCRNALGVLSFVPEHYSLNGLYNYLFDLETRITIDDQISQLKDRLTLKEKRLLNSYWQYHEKIFDRFDEKVKSGVNATVAQVLAPFNHPDLIDAFCTEDSCTEASEKAKDAFVDLKNKNENMEDVLNGAVFLVEMPLSTWGLGGKIIYTLIKLRFFNVMQKRVTVPNWNQKRPVFFMCDEFQEIVSANKDGISDLNFWDKARSSKTIGIVSAQAISSFYAAIGDRDIANALLQNFRQKICFRTEDTTTLNYFHGLADKVEVIRKTHSKTSGNSTQKSLFGNGSESNSNTESISYTEKTVLDAQLFRSLQPDQALALLSIDGKSMDDVINTFAIYI